MLKEGKVTELLAASAYDTLIIPSKSKPTKPHIIFVYPNGKVACKDCQGYSASYLRAHAVAASLKRGTLEAYLKWLVANKQSHHLWNASWKRQEGRTTDIILLIYIPPDVLSEIKELRA